jgi:hypothetical protein
MDITLAARSILTIFDFPFQHSGINGLTSSAKLQFCLLDPTCSCRSCTSLLVQVDEGGLDILNADHRGRNVLASGPADLDETPSTTKTNSGISES